jgi:perosamine synthetase
MIPVFEPEVTEDDARAVADAVRRGEISGSFGSSIPSFEAAVARVVGTRHAVAVSSGTTALHLACVALGVRPGDEVLVSASTNIATALAVAHCGGVPVPVDSDDSRDGCWNLDVARLEALIGPRTVGVIAVHLFGHPVDMDALNAIARRRGLWVVEDCAESLGATMRGRWTGALSDVGCHSFYANKVVTTGEGGMLTTDRDDIAASARLHRNLGFREPRFVHDVLAFNYRMIGMQAALGLSQMARLEQVVAAKRLLADRYRSALRGVSGIRFPEEPSFGRSVHWMIAVEATPELSISRDALAAHLRSSGVETRTFFCPMNQQPALRALPQFRATECPVADRIWRTGLYLPSSPTLSDADIDVVVGAIASATKGRG